jgi:hypothetical protein
MNNLATERLKAIDVILNEIDWKDEYFDYLYGRYPDKMEHHIDYIPLNLYLKIVLIRCLEWCDGSRDKCFFEK